MKVLLMSRLDFGTVLTCGIFAYLFFAVVVFQFIVNQASSIISKG